MISNEGTSEETMNNNILGCICFQKLGKEVCDALKEVQTGDDIPGHIRLPRREGREG